MSAAPEPAREPALDASPPRIDAPRRTSPLGVVVGAVGGLTSAILPLLAIGYSARADRYGVLVIVIVIVLVLFLSGAFSALAWYRRTYRVGADDIRVDSGVLSRAARSIPFERIQDVSLEQPFLARLLGLVSVTFETGAGGSDEIALAYLEEEEGERLRELVRARKSGRAVPGATTGDKDGGGEEDETLFAMDARRVVTFGLFEFSLAVVAVLAGAAQQFEAFLPIDLWDLEDWQARLAGPGAWLAGLGPMAQIVGILLAIAGLVLVGMVTGVIRTVLRDWGFVLQRTAKGFRRRRGLLTRTDVVMPVHRVQALVIGTGWLRRRFGWHSLKLVSLAGDSGSANHVAAPFARMDELAPIIAASGFRPAGPKTAWHRASARYRTDSVVLTLALFALIAAAAFVAQRATGAFDSAWVLAPIGVGLLVAALDALAWRYRRHALSERQLFTRQGVLAPKTTLAERRKLHSVELRQGPLARRRGYASVHFGLAGGTLAIEGLPLSEARAIRDAVLETICAADYSTLQ